MNPFELRGPEFLLFYFCLAVLLLTLLALTRRWDEPDPMFPVRLTDPYAIAYLRGWANELLRIVTVGLIDRQLLVVDEKHLKATDQSQTDLVQQPLEHAVLQFFSFRKEPAKLFSNSLLKGYCESFEPALIELGLIPTESAKKGLAVRLFCVLAVLWATASIKIMIGVSRHRPVSFLVMLALATTFVSFLVARVSRTRRGDQLLSNLQTLMSGLQARSGSLKEHANTNELVLLGAVFGLAAVPETVFPHRKALFPAAAAGGGCGSACGSSSGGSCGGGCGGGCGGCGA